MRCYQQPSEISLNLVSLKISFIIPHSCLLVQTISDAPKNPCLPTPCGPFSQCRDDNNNLAICSCLPNYYGSPPNCKPECTINADCPNDLSCQNQRCKNPCMGSCGYSAECIVSNHNANCFCPIGTTGDPFTSCNPISTPRKNTFNKFLNIHPLFHILHHSIF